MTTSSSASRQVQAGHQVTASRPGADGSGRESRLAVKTALPALAALQSAALGIYGRLEPDRALVWTVEELGELAQAVRRDEGPARLAEELGQLTTWMLCLANILNVDLAAAVETAIQEEIDRQLAKYGQLTPYQNDRSSR